MSAETPDDTRGFGSRIHARFAAVDGWEPPTRLRDEPRPATFEDDCEAEPGPGSATSDLTTDDTYR